VFVPGSRYLPRLLDSQIEDLFGAFPALMLTGARATGKTTTARRYVKTVVRLDREGEAAAFRADPDAALAALPEPILLDEWQMVPGLLGAVKRAVDDGSGVGRFLLTGSVNAVLTGEPWPGTGRVLTLHMEGLTEREVVGRAAATPFLERLADSALEGTAALGVLPDTPDLLGYVELALRGGFPESALAFDLPRAARWLEGYLSQLLSRDATGLDRPRDPVLLRRYFEAVALNTAGSPSRATLAEVADIDARTAQAYDRLLTNLFVLDWLPAWSGNRLKRLTRGAKRHLADPALVGAALGLDSAAVLRDGNVLGRLIETFAIAQLRPEAQLGPNAPRFYHLRDLNGRREIDLVVELGGGDVIAIEVKATATPKVADARHIEWLRDQIGDRFRAGAVLHTGPQAFQLTEHVLALPIASIWAAAE
jgi:predicted AAA+ superfamily ATPase